MFGTSRPALTGILLAHLCLGVAAIAVLPPFEGFDETGHYSSLQQVADRHELPRQPAARMSAVVAAYAARAPMPYSSAAPFDVNGGRTYAEVFAAGGVSVEDARQAVHDPPPRPRAFEPGSHENYIAQHPPLFSLILAPIYLATRTASLGAQLFALRVAAYALAWTGLVLGVAGLASNARAWHVRPIALYAAASWPIFMPSWYPAMARLGNDSLAALLVGLLWYWLTTRGYRTTTSAVVVGALLAAGALTKAFFVPVAVGTLAWCAVGVLELEPGARARRAARVLLSATIAVVVSAWWYVGPAALAVAGSESRQLTAMGGLRHALALHFSVRGWLDGAATFFGMAAWSGTWSLARPPQMFFVPIVVGIGLGAAAALWAIRHRSISTAPWLAFWWLTPVLAGFAYHILVHVALTGSGRGVGGYYLHVLAAPLAAALGLGIDAVWRWRTARVVAGLHGLYAAAFLVAVSCAQVWLFTGFMTKDASKHYAWTGALSAWPPPSDVFSRLDVLAYPRVAAMAAASGVGLLCLSAARARQRIDREDANA